MTKPQITVGLAVLRYSTRFVDGAEIGAPGDSFTAYNQTTPSKSFASATAAKPTAKLLPQGPISLSAGAGSIVGMFDPLLDVISFVSFRFRVFLSIIPASERLSGYY